MREFWKGFKEPWSELRGALRKTNLYFIGGTVGVASILLPVIVGFLALIVWGAG